MKIFNQLLITLIIYSLPIAQMVRAQEIVQPTAKISNRSFAIFVDKATFDHCRNDIISYKEAIENTGLPTFIISHDWRNPEQVKKEIITLHSNAQLEGMVLIGDIPIVLIGKAQHFARNTIPIPSDRFYDDFDLAFDFVEQSRTNPLHFFYNLGIASAHKIRSDIYSARLKPLKVAGKDKYSQISLYLQKAATAHQQKNTIDNIATYFNTGYVCNAVSAWSSASVRLEEQFPLLSTTSTQGQTYREGNPNFERDEVINQIRRKDLDIVIMHEQHTPGATVQPLPLIGHQDIDLLQPNVLFTIFDSNHEGDFGQDDYVAGRFIFAKGNTVTALASTISSTAPINTSHLLGTLSMGLNIGRWAQFNTTLESHVIGDPTFTFSISSSDTINGFLYEKNNKKLLDGLSKVKSPEAKSVIFTQLFANKYEGLSKLIEQEYDKSDSPNLRYTCVYLASQLGGNVKLSLLKKGSKDADELIRRYTINTMARVGDPSFIPSLLEAYIENQHAEQVLYAVKMALYAFHKDLIKNIAEHAFSTAHFTDPIAQKERFYNEQFSGSYADMDKGIFDPKSAHRKQSIGSLKEVNYHPSIGRYVEFVRDSKVDADLRIAMLEALTWFQDSYRKSEIITACQELIADTRHSKKIRDEARRTLNTIR